MEKTVKMMSIPFVYDLDQSQGFPFITFTEGNLKGFCFLVDSGSNQCLLFQGSVHEHMDKLELLPDKGTIWGIGGRTSQTSYVRVDVKFLSWEGQMVFQVVDNAPSDKFFEETSIRMHGILGTSFLWEHNLLLDIVNQRLLAPVVEDDRKTA